jgi:hypothetical protein
VKGQSIYAEVDGGLRRRKTKATLGLVWPALMAIMSAVMSFPCRAGQENNLHSGSAFAVWARNLVWLPINWVWYAELALYLPSEVIVQEMESGWSGVSCKVATMSQICKYCDSCRGVESSNRSDPPAIRSLRGGRPLLPGCYVVEVCGLKMKWGEITPAVVPKRGPHSIP